MNATLCCCTEVRNGCHENPYIGIGVNVSFTDFLCNPTMFSPKNNPVYKKIDWEKGWIAEDDWQKKKSVEFFSCLFDWNVLLYTIMIIYTDTTHKKTRKQQAKEESQWLAQCQRDGLMPNGKKFQTLTIPVAPVSIRAGADDFKKCQSLKTTESYCSRPPDKVYTGTAMIGISQMSKSNAVPVFNTDHIMEIARMRR